MPDVVLSTNRLRVADTRREDVGVLLTLLSDPAVATSALPHLRAASADDLAEELDAKPAQGQEGRLNLTVRQWEGAIPIGQIRFNIEAGEVSYWLGRPYWGFGYATEALTALLADLADWYWHSIITAVTLRSHTTSQRVLIKAGFRFQGLTHLNAAQLRRIACVRYAARL